ncbi:BTAD domain-containing putative transcriptional regulator [Nocardioides sp. GCM10027113]|uniref:nSTAND1 domain-containing NTPase n=1 Tax=unclassified Nocardioides TaxID=2615069 RepID=UPI003618DCED
MVVNVLGPVAVDGDRGSLTPRDRVVLAALAMTPREVVSADRLADALWGEEPPATWSKVVQGCVVRIRKVLGSEAIRTTRQGYVLDVSEDAVDAFQFERQVRRGRELLSLREPERARYTVGQALGLWRGAALADLDGWAPAEDAARRWEEMRRDAEELGVEASLAAGAWREVLTEAGRLVAEQPFRESRWALLARAQYQAGRQAESLATLQRARAVLTGELGLDPGPDLAALEAAILRQDPDLLPRPERARASTACPYRGLLFYDVDDSEEYFGRDAEVDTCRQILDRQGIVAVVGPSGSGKSSLVRAGVAASLRRDGRALATITPGPHPMAALADVKGLRADSVLVVDQLEEAVTVCTDLTEREAFFDALAARADAGQGTVLALRADRLGLLSAHKPLSRLLERGLYLLGAMDEDDLRSAVEGPARQAGLLVEAGLVDILVHEVADEPGALPLLSHALAQTWERREGGTLTVEGYRSSGGIQGAVAQTAEDVFVGLTPEEQGTARDLLLRLVVSVGTGEPSRSPVPRRAAAPDPAHEQVVETLVAARLLTSDGEILALAHESLARAWPRLRGWLDADSEGQLILRHLTVAADAWQGMGRPDSELYRGARLARAMEWRQATHVHLTDTEVQFLDASVARAREESRTAEERVREQAQINRRLRGLLAGVVAVLVLALVAGGLAVRESRRADDQASRADDQARLAVVRELAAASRAARVDDPELAALLALEASSPELARAGHVEREAVEALHGAVRASRIVYVTEDGGGAVAWSGNGDLIATEGPEETGLVDLRDAVTGEPVARFEGHDIDVNDVAFGPGDVVATAGDDGDLRAWDPDDHHLLAEVLGDGQVWGPSFSTTGPTRLAAAWFDEGVVRVATLDDAWKPRTTRTIKIPGGPFDTSLSPDGASLAVATADPVRARVVDVRSGRIRFHLRGHVANLSEVAYSPDGRWIATSSDDGTVRIVDADTGAPRHVIAESSAGVRGIAWAPDSARVAAGGWDGKVRVHELTEDAASTSMVMSGASTEGGVWRLAFSPDGQRLLSGNFPVTAATVWDVGLHGDAEVANLPAGPPGAAGAAFDSRGRLYLHDVDESLRVTDDDGALIAHLEKPTDLRAPDGAPPPQGLAVSADGSTAGTGATDLGVTVWDVASGEHLFSTGRGTWQSTPAFSADGQLVAVGGDEELTVRTRFGEVLARLKDGRGYFDPAFSPDGRTVVVASGPTDRPVYDRNTVSWEWETGTTTVLAEGERFAPKFSPDGTKVAIAAASVVSIIVDAESAEVLAELEGSPAGVADLAWSPDGSRIATAGIDGQIIVWDPTQGSQILELPPLPYEVYSIAFSPDGRHLVTTSRFETLARVWTLDVEELRQIAAGKVRRGLTAAECATYLHGRGCTT